MKQSKILYIPEGVAKIPDGAYSGNLDIEEVIIPEGTVEIGSEAFIFCENLLSVTHPSS